ncbi:hypothetical protein LJB63_21500, partial [[Eubacterium] rectale]|nr:hypothetical protein [Agathobacter rectalis]
GAPEAGEAPAAATGWGTAAGAMEEAGAAPTGDFNTFSLGTALSGAAAGDFSAAAGAASVLKTFNLGAPTAGAGSGTDGSGVCTAAGATPAAWASAAA